MTPLEAAVGLAAVREAAAQFNSDCIGVFFENPFAITIDQSVSPEVQEFLREWVIAAVPRAEQLQPLPDTWVRAGDCEVDFFFHADGRIRVQRHTRVTHLPLDFR